VSLKSFVLFSVAIATLSCGSSSTNPFVPTGGGNTGSTKMISGTLLSYGDRTPLTGVAITLGQSISTTDNQGRFSFANAPTSGGAVLTASPPGHLFRGFGVSLSQAPANLIIDAIRDAAPFSLAFYRAWARNGFESLELQATKPWTRDPSFYVQMLVDGTTTRVDPDVVEQIRQDFVKSIPDLTGGKFHLASFETGDAPRPLADGWVNLTFYTQLGGAFAQSSVGGNSGTMSIRYGMVSSQTTNPTNCSSPEVSLADHEITHTMGFWHTQNVFADSFSGTGCPGAPRPDHIRYHSTVMYSRPVGNKDPDLDPAPTTGLQAPGSETRVVVSCFGDGSRLTRR